MTQKFDFDEMQSAVESAEPPPQQGEIKKNKIVSKSAFPIARFSGAIAITLLGILLCLLVSLRAPLNPMPFYQSFSVTDPATWLYPIERHAVMRIPMIISGGPITSIAEIENNLGVTLEDGRRVLVSPEGVISELSASDVEGSPQISRVTRNITVNPNRPFLESTVLEEVRGMVNRIDLENLNQITMTVYWDVSVPFQQNQYEQLQQQQQRQQKSIGKEGAEPQKKSEFGAVYNEQTAKRVSDDYATELARFVSQLVPSGVEIVASGVGMQQHYDNGWQPGAGGISGVFVEFISEITVARYTWEPVSANQQSNQNQSGNDNSVGEWSVVSNDLIVRFDENLNPTTVAALLSAFNRYFGVSDNSDGKLAFQSLQVQQYPSPLGLVMLVISGFIAFRLLSVASDEPDKEVIKEQQIVDSFVSDAPANDLTQDRLGFVEISSALSRFLRNAGTKAPLTLAITGMWGSGKSSLMYFLKQNLQSYRLHPVWVNAWHHQNEEQFLAGLLSAIQAKAIPPFWTPAGMLYRWNLLRMRWSEAPLFFFISTSILLLSLGYLLTSGDASFNHLTDLSKQTVPYLGAAFGALSLLRGGMDRLSGMINANILQALLRTPGRNLDLRSNVGLREKFAKEFKMLCNALGDSTLTIFIDDLDRCKEQRIMDVMETINYLVSSGDCFIVLGMEKEPIEKAIATYYMESHSELDSEELRQKSKRYLEKIINIEIPVPSASSDQFEKLIDKVPEPPHSSRWQWLKPLVLVSFFGLSLLFGSYLAGLLDPDEVSQGSLNEEQVVVDDPSVRWGLRAPIQDQPLEKTANQSQPLVIDPQVSSDYNAYVLVPFLLVALAALIIRVERYRQRKRIVENDSEDFLHAVATWAKALGLSQRTPRNIKRYVNRARYLAMRNYESEAKIRDDNLVTLAALLEFAGQASDSDLESMRLAIPEFDDPEVQDKIRQLLEQSKHIDEHKKHQFLHWVRGVSVN